MGRQGNEWIVIVAESGCNNNRISYHNAALRKNAFILLLLHGLSQRAFEFREITNTNQCGMT